MYAPTGGVMLEGVYLAPVVVETMAYLSSVLELLERGEEPAADPYYQAEPPISDEQVDRVVAALDAEMAHEMNSFAPHHLGRSGATTTPDFFRLSPAGRRALVEGVDAIFGKHRALCAAPEEGA